MLVLRLDVLYTTAITRILPKKAAMLIIVMAVVKNIETAYGHEARSP